MLSWIRSAIIGLCTALIGLVLTVTEFGREYERVCDVSTYWTDRVFFR